MSMVLNFFPRQVLFGSAEYKSEIFDVVEYAEIEAEARAFAVQGSSPSATVTLEGTNDPRLSEWETTATFTALTTKSAEVATVGKTLRYIRASVTISADDFFSIEVIGVARESS